MATFSEIVREISATVKEIGAAQETPQGELHRHAELQAFHADGAFDGLIFSALETQFFVDENYQLRWVPRGEEGVSFRELSRDLERNMQSYLAWRLGLLRQLKI